jgi:hypothetical protein
MGVISSGLLASGADQCALQWLGKRPSAVLAVPPSKDNFSLFMTIVAGSDKQHSRAHGRHSWTLGLRQWHLSLYLAASQQSFLWWLCPQAGPLLRMSSQSTLWLFICCAAIM